MAEKTILVIGPGAAELSQQLAKSHCYFQCLSALDEAEVQVPPQEQKIDLIVHRNAQPEELSWAKHIPQVSFKAAFAWSDGEFRQDPPGWDMVRAFLLDKVSRTLARLEKRQVLILDDESAIRRSLGAIFQRLGFAVHTKEARTDNLETFLKNKIDIILLDVNMPGLSWQEYTQRVRKVSPQTLVYLTTGNRTVEAGDTITGVLHKPFGLQEVSELAQQVLLAHPVALKHSVPDTYQEL